MKIYKLRSDSEKFISFNYASLDDIDSGISDEYETFMGEVLKSKWIIPNLAKSKNSHYKDASNKRIKLEIPDIWGSYKTALFSEKAKNILDIHIVEYGEFLLANTDIGKYYYYNTLLVLDALDYKNSMFEYWDEEQTRIRKVIVHQFEKSLVKDLIIFKLKDFEQICIYVTDKFKEIVEQNELKAFIFEEVWDSENVNKFEENRNNNKEKDEEELRKNNIDRNRIANESELLEIIKENDWYNFIIEYFEYLNFKMLLQSKSNSNVNIESMNRINQIIYSVYSYYFEITNGGFNGYVINTEGKQAENIDKYLNLIYANENAKLFKEVFEYVNQLDTGSVKDIYELVELLNNEKMEKLNSKYEKLVKNENIYDLLILFIKENINEIKENLAQEVI